MIDDWRVHYPYRERPFGMTDQSDSEWVLDKITPQPIQAFTETIRLKNGGSSKIPRTYIHLRPPVELPPETEFFQFAERARTQPDWKHQELVSGHDAMVIIPEAVAALLLEQDKDM